MAKNFTESPAMSFISEETKQEVKKAKTTTRRTKKKDAGNIPFGYSVAPDPKSEKLPLLVKRVTKNALMADAEAEGTSVNDIANRIFEKYYSERG